MSLERAAVNCMRCYNLANDFKDALDKSHDEGEKGTTPFELKSLIHNQGDLYAVRNQAMEALEEHLNRFDTLTILKASEMYHGTSGVEKLNNTVQDALIECKDCEFEKPEISCILYPEDKIFRLP